MGQSPAGASKASLARGWLEIPVQWGGAVLSGDCLQGCGERMGQGCQRSSYEPEVSLGGSRPGVKRPVCYYQLQMLGGGWWVVGEGFKWDVFITSGSKYPSEVSSKDPVSNTYPSREKSTELVHSGPPAPTPSPPPWRVRGLENGMVGGGGVGGESQKGNEVKGSIRPSHSPCPAEATPEAAGRGQ